MAALEAAMMGRGRGDQTSLFYQFRLDERVPEDSPAQAYRWFCDGGARVPQPHQCPILVGAGKPAVSDHIGGEYRGELPGLGHEVFRHNSVARRRVTARRNVGKDTTPRNGGV
jgi:hypothetical protein